MNANIATHRYREKKSIEVLKEFYDKYKNVIDILAAADDKVFKAVREICIDKNYKGD